MKLNFNLNLILIFLIINIYKISWTVDHSVINYRAELAEQRKRTMRVCNSKIRFSRASDTQNNRLLVFGILSPNVELTELALDRDTAGATFASIELFETIYTGATTVDGVTTVKIDFEHPFSRTDVTLPFLAAYMASARPTAASHAIRSAVTTLCYRDAMRRARK